MLTASDITERPHSAVWYQYHVLIMLMKKRHLKCGCLSRFRVFLVYDVLAVDLSLGLQ